MPKPLIVGEAPGKNGDPTKPIEGRIGRRLAHCAGMEFEQFLSAFQRINLLDEQPQDAKGGMRFNLARARQTALVLHDTLVTDPHPMIILLGKRVAKAFEIKQPEYFHLEFLCSVETYVVPHPSGVNHWWNNWDNELEMMRFMRNIVVPRLT